MKRSPAGNMNCLRHEDALRADEAFPRGDHDGVPAGRLKKAFRKELRQNAVYTFPESLFFMPEGHSILSAKPLV